MNKAKVPCNLITGQERDEIEGAKHTSVTVEMADVSGEYQCAVIDEIQVLFFLLYVLFHMTCGCWIFYLNIAKE